MLSDKQEQLIESSLFLYDEGLVQTLKLKRKAKKEGKTYVDVDEMKRKRKKMELSLAKDPSKRGTKVRSLISQANRLQADHDAGRFMSEHMPAVREHIKGLRKMAERYKVKKD